MDTIEIRETMSAMADGQLHGDAFARGLEFAARDAGALQAWHDYHLIGDVLRSGELAGGTPAADFLGRLQARLRDEHLPVQAVAARVDRVTMSEAANDGSFRWKLVAGFASLAAVAAIGWNLVVPGAGNAPQGAQMASTVPPGTVLAGSERGVMIRDARLDELMAAHRQLGGGSALQTPAGFLRNATFDGSGR